MRRSSPSVSRPSVVERAALLSAAGSASVGRAAQFRSAFRFRRFRFDRLDPGALDMRCLDARRYPGPRCIGRAGLLARRMQRTRPGHGACQQHLCHALMTEVAIGKAHARNRATEVTLVFLVEIEARLERNALDRRADGLAADLKRIAGKAHVAHRARTADLYCACGATIIKHTACAASAVETSKREHLAGYELAGFIGIHLSRQDGSDHRTGRQGTQHETRNHAVTPTLPSRGNRLISLPDAYHTNSGNIGAASLVKSEQA